MDIIVKRDWINMVILYKTRFCGRVGREIVTMPDKRNLSKLLLSVNPLLFECTTCYHLFNKFNLQTRANAGIRRDMRIPHAKLC